MPAQLDPTVAAEMNKQAKAAQERMTSGSFVRSWDLGGKNAVVAEGAEVVVRLLPRWDYINSMKKDPTTNKLVPNPDYRKGTMWALAYEHWWTAPDGKKTREWCTRSLSLQAACPICEASERLRVAANADDRKFGKDVSAREVYIFNAVIGKPRRIDQAKRADIRILKTPATVFVAVRKIMQGGEEANAAFAKGDVTDPLQGYDLLFTRPVKNSGTQWQVACATAESRLFETDQAEQFRGWPTMMTNVEEMLEKEVKDYTGLFKAYHGRDPRPEELPGQPVGAEPGAESVQAPADVSGFDAPVSAPTAAPPLSPDDEFMPPPAASQPSPGRPASPAKPAPRRR